MVAQQPYRGRAGQKSRALPAKTVLFLEFLCPRNMQLKRIHGQGWELAPSRSTEGDNRIMPLANRPASAETDGAQPGRVWGHINLWKCICTGPLHPSSFINVDKKVKKMASNCWTASAAAPSTAAPRQTRRAVGFAGLGGLPLSALRSAGNRSFPPESRLFPLEFRRKTVGCERGSRAVASDCTGASQARVMNGEGLTGRLMAWGGQLARPGGDG